ncbi:hypothetical protein D3C87_21250 [compost metagenome]
MKVSTNLPIGLENLLIKLEEEDGGIVISSLEYKDSDLEIHFKASFPNSEIPEQIWKIQAINIEKERFVRDWSVNIQLFVNHQLLLEFNENHSELYYRGKVTAPEKLAFDLFQVFTENEWKDLQLGLGINAPEGFLKLCNREAGLFARGPRSLLDRYFSLLHENGVHTRMLDNMEKNRQELVLLLFGQSYFVAEEFVFDQIK